MNHNKKNKFRLRRKRSENSGFLKYLLGIFVATEDMPYSAQTFVRMARKSKKRHLIWALLVFFWMALFGIIFISILFLKSSGTLFNVVAVTEKIEVSTFDKVQYPPWYLNKAKLYNDCGSDMKEVSGTLNIDSHSFIEFTRIDQGKLFITIEYEEKERKEELEEEVEEEVEEEEKTERNVGQIQGVDLKLSDCIVLEYSPTVDETFTIPIDGKITIGSAIKESVNRTPILLEGKIYIADKAVISQEYYVSDPYELNMGDKFTIKDQSTQSSGFIYVNNESGMKVSYATKGKSGDVERYKLENINLKNNFWTKLYNDETVILLWIFIGVLYTTVKIAIRFCINEDEENE